jgi:hypothetical protein
MGNLGPIGSSKRMIFGAAMLIAGIVLTIAFLFHHVLGPWLLVLFIPFWLGSLGLLQGGAST